MTVLSSQALAISSEEQAWSYLETALEGKYDSNVVELVFDDWPTFKINVKGDRYDSTLTSSLMRSLVELQTHLNRVYADVVHGKSAKHLTLEEREALEIIFKVESGSSNVVADLSGFFTALGNKAMEKMTGTQVVSVVLGAAALWAAASAHDSYIDSKLKATEEANRHQLTLTLLEQQPKLLQIQTDQIEAYTNIFRSVPDADQVILDDDKKFDKKMIEIITASERQTTVLKRIDDFYKISMLKSQQDRYKIELIRISDDKNISAGLNKGHLSLDEMEKLTNAFLSETSISLNVVARTRGDIVTSANIVGVNDQAKGQTIDGKTVQ